MANFLPIKMTWQQTIPLLVVLIKDADKEGKKFAYDELMRLAKHVDEQNEKNGLQLTP